MRDVFKYFKYARSVQQDVLAESTTSERARELGYEYRSRGVWLDPRTGKNIVLRELSSGKLMIQPRKRTSSRRRTNI